MCADPAVVVAVVREWPGMSDWQGKMFAAVNSWRYGV